VVANTSAGGKVQKPISKRETSSLDAEKESSKKETEKIRNWDVNRCKNLIQKEGGSKRCRLKRDRLKKPEEGGLKKVGESSASNKLRRKGHPPGSGRGAR